MAVVHVACAVLALSAAIPGTVAATEPAPAGGSGAAPATQAARDDDPDAMLELGLAYDTGHGAPQDTTKACELYRRAGERQSAQAAFNLAALLSSGRCDGSAERAAQWFARAAALGHARAAFDMGQLYESGTGVPRNDAAAVNWYRLAAAGGIPAAATRAASLSRTDMPPGAADLRPALPEVPQGEVHAGSAAPVRLPFAWAAPAQRGPVRFFLEVYALAPNGATETTAAYCDQTATVALLPGAAGPYAWRVLTVALPEQRYVESAWRRFEVTP